MVADQGKVLHHLNYQYVDPFRKSYVFVDILVQDSGDIVIREKIRALS